MFRQRSQIAAPLATVCPAPARLDPAMWPHARPFSSGAAGSRPVRLVVAPRVRDGSSRHAGGGSHEQGGLPDAEDGTTSPFDRHGPGTSDRTAATQRLPARLRLSAPLGANRDEVLLAVRAEQRPSGNRPLLDRRGPLGRLPGSLANHQRIGQRPGFVHRHVSCGHSRPAHRRAASWQCRRLPRTDITALDAGASSSERYP